MSSVTAYQLQSPLEKPSILVKLLFGCSLILSVGVQVNCGDVSALLVPVAGLAGAVVLFVMVSIDDGIWMLIAAGLCAVWAWQTWQYWLEHAKTNPHTTDDEDGEELADIGVIRNQVKIAEFQGSR